MGFLRFIYIRNNEEQVLKRLCYLQIWSFTCRALIMAASWQMRHPPSPCPSSMTSWRKRWWLSFATWGISPMSRWPASWTSLRKQIVAMLTVGEKVDCASDVSINGSRSDGMCKRRSHVSIGCSVLRKTAFDIVIAGTAIWLTMSSCWSRAPYTSAPSQSWCPSVTRLAASSRWRRSTSHRLPPSFTTPSWWTRRWVCSST